MKAVRIRALTTSMMTEPTPGTTRKAVEEGPPLLGEGLHIGHAVGHSAHTETAVAGDHNGGITAVQLFKHGSEGTGSTPHSPATIPYNIHPVRPNM